MTLTTSMPETQAAKDLRKFTIILDFAEGEIFKEVNVIDPETAVEDVIRSIRASKETGSDYSDILCADVPCGKIRGRRGGKWIVIAEWRQKDGFAMADNITICGPDGHEIK
jgi:hypothetical protein